ncbi:MAG: hypothetical protein AAFN10_17800, partial [Bacteroidota bacterium]
VALLEDLVDHLCSSIEEEMAEGLDFDTAYARSRERLISGSAREIQNATSFLINYQHLFIMRKIMFFSTFSWLFLWLTSVLFGMLQLPAAGQLSMISGIILGVFALPSYILYRRQQPGTKSLLERLSIYAAAPTAVLMTFACTFKLMHWPGANSLLVSGLISLTCVFLPLLFLFYYQQDPQTQSI